MIACLHYIISSKCRFVLCEKYEYMICNQIQEQNTPYAQQHAVLSGESYYIYLFRSRLYKPSSYQLLVIVLIAHGELY